MAISDNAVGGISGGVSDIFAGFGDLDKAQGADLEGQSYTEAAGLALEDKQFTQTSTAIKQNQADRELFTSMGRTTAAGTGSGLDVSGSAVDILRQSASEGATAKAVAGQQGLITEAGYQEQSDSYNLMASAADKAASADKTAAIGSFIAGGINIVAGLASLGGGGAAPLAPTTSNDPTQIGALY